MFDAIRSFLLRRDAQATPDESHGPRSVQLAACALLLELAYADGEFSDVERQRIEDALGRHFGLNSSETQELLTLAGEERRRSIDHFQFTRVLNEQYDLGQKMVLAEVMWGVILADGHLADHEAYLVRKIANLLNLEPGYLSQARKAANSPDPDGHTPA
ncbi:MAG: TerB family tellurite resistance protein [Gemmatimonadaceae bacterium]